MPLTNLTLELSLKPFRDPSDAGLQAVCRHLFAQWQPLLARASQVSILLWVADGSEILDYRGDLDAELEWARYIGGANPRQHIPGDPEGQCLHSRWYLYCDDPPRFTLRDLARIVATLKRVGAEVTGLPVRVGETFDPGPEFARSPFKYERHNEICLSGTMGHTSFVGCYATLHADPEPYAGYPGGIPEGLPLGAFLGRQSQVFLTDLGFDYLWLSNGFGFGMETWGTTGAIFDGQAFHPERSAATAAAVLDFWRQFRAGCPTFPLETRGTNLTTGIDLASDACPLRDIYRGGFGLQPPPNSPWAALNGDFGFELVGYMSHIAQLPGESFPFRFYTHDPWWLNSPWLDRYGREPHDIYLPLSVSRVDAAGRTCRPSSLSLLTADDSLGNLPDQVPQEVIPHLAAALDDAPDAPGPVVWLYPFDEYHEMALGPDNARRLPEVFFGDWFIRAAINHGFPLSTVTSTADWLTSREASPDLWRDRILLSIAPDAGTPLESALLSHLHQGGKLLLYGPLTSASEALLSALNAALAEPVSGPLTLHALGLPDILPGDGYPTRVDHDPLLTGGPLCEVLADPACPHTRVLATAEHASGTRLAALHRALPAWKGGAIAWVRGVDSYSFPGGHLLSMAPADRAFPGGVLLRAALACLGFAVGVIPLRVGQRAPITTLAATDGGYYLSGYTPDTTVALSLCFPPGAPILTGWETELRDGRAILRMPRAWHRECRVFIADQPAGVISCLEQHSGEIGIRRRLLLSGLEGATVRFMPPTGCAGAVTMLREPRYPFLEGDFLQPSPDPDHPGYLTVRQVSGSLLISW